jgi:sulfur carrier protein
MNIYLNDEAVWVDEPVTLQGALQRFGYEGNAMAVAINREFIPRRHHGSVFLKEADRIDIVIPMQGG